jgi:hypothetical protein
MITAEQLVGVWIDENFGGLGPTVMLLFPDGRGANDIYNGEYAGREQFHWELDEQGTRLRFSQYDWGSPQTHSYRVSLKFRGDQRILRIELEMADDPDRGMFGGHFVRDYYRTSISVEDWVPPK